MFSKHRKPTDAQTIAVLRSEHATASAAARHFAGLANRAEAQRDEMVRKLEDTQDRVAALRATVEELHARIDETARHAQYWKDVAWRLGAEVGPVEDGVPGPASVEALKTDETLPIPIVRPEGPPVRVPVPLWAREQQP